jgi:hypothetical protein
VTCFLGTSSSNRQQFKYPAPGLVGQFVELVMASVLRKKTAIRAVSKWSYVQQVTRPAINDRVFFENGQLIRWNKFRQIFISYHLATGKWPFNFRPDERLPAVSIHYRRVIHIRLMRWNKFRQNFISYLV